jgi:hypothetical protein
VQFEGAETTSTLKSQQLLRKNPDKNDGEIAEPPPPPSTTTNAAPLPVFDPRSHRRAPAAVPSLEETDVSSSNNNEEEQELPNKLAAMRLHDSDDDEDGDSDDEEEDDAGAPGTTKDGPLL